MATGKALDGKPYAGNPHVRFDEGEVAPAATPRRGSLLYKSTMLKAVFAASLASIAGGASASTITIESVAQRWPWNNKLDITYLVDGGQVGSAYARIEFTATIAGRQYTFTSGDIGASAADGRHTATWTIPTGLRASGCTVKADLVASDVPSGNDYMIVDLTSGAVIYEGLFADQNDSNSRYNTDTYKTGKLVLRKVPAGGPYPTGIDTDEGGKKGSSAYPSGSMTSSQKNWTIDRDYYISIFELTQSQYTNICGATTFSANIGDKNPANNLKYFQLRGDHTVPTNAIPAVASNTGTFFQRLNFKTGLYFDLPTDVMWEIAARAGATTVYSWGENTTNNLERYVVLNSVKEVGTKLPNNWGIYDTTGNVDEICRDDNSRLDMASAASPFVAAWYGEWGDWNNGRYRMSRRGGPTGISADEDNQRKTSYRHMIKPDVGYGATGFRVSYIAE